MPETNHRSPTVFLFDVDGTLLSAAGAGRRALERAFTSLCGTAAGLRDIRFNGMTDPGIVRAGLDGLGRAAEPGLMVSILDAYLSMLPEELERATGFQVFPGVTALLETLVARSHVAVGLGTGNLREGARQKLDRAGLGGYFAFGGFGCDHEERAELLRIGARRGAALLGVDAATCRVIVVGDTPHDVSAARAIGASCLGVATGGCGPDVLRAAGATWALDDLTTADLWTALDEGEAT